MEIAEVDVVWVIAIDDTFFSLLLDLFKNLNHDQTDNRILVLSFLHVHKLFHSH